MPRLAGGAVTAWDFVLAAIALLVAQGLTAPVLAIPLVLLIGVVYLLMLWRATRPGRKNGVTQACAMLHARIVAPGGKPVTFAALIVRRAPSVLALSAMIWLIAVLLIQRGTPFDQRSDAAVLLAVAPVLTLTTASITAAITLRVMIWRTVTPKRAWLRAATELRTLGDAAVWSRESYRDSSPKH